MKKMTSESSFIILNSTVSLTGCFVPFVRISSPLKIFHALYRRGFLYSANWMIASSPLLTKGVSGPHGLQGIGANFVPEILDQSLIDEIIPVTDADAYRMGREMGKKEGILVGITSGAALYAAIALAKRPENAGKTIVALLPDTGDRYLSTPLFEEGKDEA